MVFTTEGRRLDRQIVFNCGIRDERNGPVVRTDYGSNALCQSILAADRPCSERKNDVRLSTRS